MKSQRFLANSLSVVAVGALSLSGIAAHAQQGTMVQTMPASGKTVMVVTPMASAMDRYMASWIYNNLDARAIRGYKAMGLSDATIKGAANIAMRSGMDMAYIVRLGRESGYNLYSIASMFNVSTKYVDSDIAGYGVDTVSMPMSMKPMTGSTSMMMPGTASGTVSDALAANPNLSTLAAAVKAAGLTDTLSGPGPFTVFAPSNDAFAKLPAGTVDNLLKPENKAMLVSILTYHVVPGKVMAADVMAMANPSMPKTVNGAPLTVKTTAPVMVNGANVTQTDIVTSNGVIHVIDTVLMPPAA